MSGPSTDPLTLAVAGYLARYKGTTLKDYRHDLGVFLDWCDTCGLAPLLAKRGHIELYVRWIEAKGYAEATIARKVGTICGFYRYAFRDEIIPKDPCEWVDRPTVDLSSQRRTYLTALELGKWLAQAREDGPMPFALGMLLGMRGLRIAEACSLNIEETTRDSGYETISFIRKGGKRATFPLPVPVGLAVRAAIGERTEGPILLNAWGKRMDRACAARIIKRVCHEARINEDVSPHSFRRSFITTALAVGIPLRDVQVAAGHADSKTTELYDMGQGNPDRDASHRLASYVMGITGPKPK